MTKFGMRFFLSVTMLLAIGFAGAPRAQAAECAEYPGHRQSLKANVAVRVKSAQGAAIAGASVAIEYQNHRNAIDGIADGEGVASFSEQHIGIPVKIRVSNAYGSALLSRKGFSIGENTVDIVMEQRIPAASVQVTVRDMANGLPLESAAVRIAYVNGAAASGVSNADGVASFEDQPTGVAASVSASFNGFSTETPVSGFASGANSLLILVQSAQSAEVGLTVMDPQGAPVFPANVSIDYASIGKSVSGSTDDRGLVAFSSQPVGVPARIEARSACGSVSLERTFVEGDNRIAATLVPVSTTLAVTVVYSDGATPATGATVTLGDRTVRTDTNGLATLEGIALGDATVSAFGRDARETQSVSLTLIGCTDRVVIRLTEQAPVVYAYLTVSVVTSSGDPVTSGGVSLSLPDGRVFTASVDPRSGTVFFSSLPVGVEAIVTDLESGQSSRILLQTGSNQLTLIRGAVSVFYEPKG